MTWNAQPNRQDVLQNSGVLGYNANYLYTMPDEAIKVKSGSGSVKTNDDGAVISAGTTSGGTAGISTIDQKMLNIVQATVHYSVYVGLRSTGTPFTDEAEVGVIKGGINKSNGAYVDLTTEEIVITSNRFPLEASMDNFDVFIFHVELDHPSGEVRVKLNSQTFTQTETASTKFGGGGPVYPAIMKSNGAGDSLGVVWSRIAVVE